MGAETTLPAVGAGAALAVLAALVVSLLPHGGSGVLEQAANNTALAVADSAAQGAVLCVVVAVCGSVFIIIVVA